MKQHVSNKALKTNRWALLFMAAIFAFSSCSKKSSAPATTDTNTIKTASFVFTINVPGNLPSGFLSIQVGGESVNGSNDLWKVNGVDQGNQTDITLVQGKDFPLGKTTTITVTANTPLSAVIVSPEIIVNDPAVVYTYTPTINGAVVKSDAVSDFSVSAANYAPTFEYPSK